MIEINLMAFLGLMHMKSNAVEENEASKECDAAGKRRGGRGGRGGTRQKYEDPTVWRWMNGPKNKNTVRLIE